VRKLVRKLEDPLHDIAFSHYIELKRLRTEHKKGALANEEVFVSI
jgi:hypothetical protein